VIAYIFRGSLLALVVAAFLVGGRTERLVATAYALAAVSSEVLRSTVSVRYHQLELGVFLVDLLLLAALLTVSLRSETRWPLCATALQIVTVLGHVAKLLKPEIWPLAYAWMMQASSFPSLAVLAFGIATSRRRRAKHARSNS
jgi:hypothetical protein